MGEIESERGSGREASAGGGGRLDTALVRPDKASQGRPVSWKRPGPESRQPDQGPEPSHLSADLANSPGVTHRTRPAPGRDPAA